MPKYDVELELRIDVDAATPQAAGAAAEALVKAELQTQHRVSAAWIREKGGGPRQPASNG